MKLIRTLPVILAIACQISCIYQRPDMHADLSVASPEFDISASPKVLFDAGHGNFHDIQTTYKPFATLLENDGIPLGIHTGPFTERALGKIDLLIIANATGPEQKDGQMTGAFAPQEMDVVTNWVKQGGSLLLIADHDPFGSASADLARALGVGMESVWTVDTLRINKTIGKMTWLEYSRENGGLGQHPILEGQDKESQIGRVMSFTGQSLSHDSTWTPLLRLSDAARNYYRRADAEIASENPSSYFAVPGQSQMIAGQVGQGRIVIAGEAAMFTAQEARILFKTIHAGFNYAGYDNKKLVLNTIHWLLFAID